ncbi:hypothetical protein [Thioalkalivibrio denitrificans]|uniref:hypothetical protein n=1 Tax=Thioalkalivibrio denitrificans TaxID=108003 RepID=UPI0011157011|nr:hypothetical protein [Thioalkalivibrio denitrificans]
MAEYLSYRHAVNAIRLLYQRSGFHIPSRTVGEQVSAEFSREITTTRMASLYALVDEQVALLRLISWYFASAIPNSPKVALSYYRLAVRQMRTLASIRLQCTFGLDTNARLQLRLLYENAVLWVRLRVDAEAFKDFSESSSRDKANEFWHKYLSRSKSERFLSSEFLASGHSWLGGYEEAIRELRNGVGLAAHPSMLASLFDASDDWKEMGDDLILANPCDASHFTLSMSILSASLPFSIKPEPYYPIEATSLFGGTRALKPYAHPTESWDEYNLQLRDMVPKLFLLSTRFSNELSVKEKR